MSRLVQANAGVFQNLLPLVGAYAKGIVRGIRPRPGDRLPSEAPRVERSSGPLRIHSDRVAAYLDVTDGADLDLRRTRLVPPLYYTTWSFGPFLGVLSSRKLGIPLLGMVHLENTLTVHRPIRPEDPITCRVLLEDLERTERSLLLKVLCENRAGETLASESRSLILVRLGSQGAHRSGEGGEKLETDRGTDRETSKNTRETSDGTTDPTTYQEIRSTSLPPDLGRRYGLLVGDVNPIHLFPVTARPFGFKQPIAHGFCLKAMVAHALVRSQGAGDPASLERLHIRFRRAVPLPTRVLCLSQKDQFLLTSEDRSQVYADGQFLISPSPGSPS